MRPRRTNRPSARNAIANETTYLRLGRTADAEKTFRRAFETPARLPYRGTPQASLAELYILLGRPSDALAVARALQVDTRTPATRVAATALEGEALLASGRTADARNAAKRARESLDTSRAGHYAAFLRA